MMHKIVKLILKNLIILMLPLMLPGCDLFNVQNEDNALNNGRKAENALKPVADSYVSSNAANENFGSQKNLIIEKGSGGTVETLIKFDVPDKFTAIKSVELQLYVRKVSMDSMEVYETGNDWTENKVTWKKRPSPKGPKLEELSKISQGWVTINLTSAVKGPGEISFILATDSSGECIFKSKESGKAPKLIITTSSDSDDPGDSGEYGSRNTFLVSMPLDKKESWKEMAFLAAVPAATKVNNGKPSIIAVSDSEPLTEYHLHYLNLYKPEKVFAIGNVQGYKNTDNLNASSIDQVTCELARFWKNSDTVVMTNLNAYKKSLSASALAGRLRVPLFFFDDQKISDSTIECLLELGVKKVVAVEPKSEIINILNGKGISVDSIKDEIEIVSWLKNKGHKVNYFAVCNSYDRSYSFAPKSSLAAPILAAAREGVVVPLKYESEYNTGCITDNTTKSQPKGAAKSADGEWRVDKCIINNKEYNIVLSREFEDLEKFHNQGNIDFNENGNFGDDNEFVRKGDLRKIGNKTYQIDIDTRRVFAPTNRIEHFSDIRFTYPHYSEIQNDIKKFINALGSHPKYMAMIGLADALPYAQIVDEGAGMKAWTYHSDQPYAQVDSDKDYDIAMGRIVGEDASIFTMSASRSVTYDDLLDNSWKNRACVFGNFDDSKATQKKMLDENNYETDLIEPGDGFDTLKYNIYSHWNHGFPFNLKPLSEQPTSPGFVTTGGCRQGNTVIVKPYEGRLSTYSDFAAVKLARVGIIGYHAFSKFADKNFTFGRMEFLQGIFDGKTLGEAHLNSINATQDKYNSSRQTEPMMFYGDPGLKIYAPK